MTWHPSLEDLMQFRNRPVTSPEPDRIAVHARECERCRAEMDVVDLLCSAESDPWTEPPATLVDRVKERPSEPPAPPVLDVPAVTWTPVDVRGPSSTHTDGPFVFSKSLPGMDVGLVIHSPSKQGTWRIEGKVYLADATNDVRILLIDGDHVLAQAEVGDGSDFVLEETATNRWHLEIHVAGRAPLRVDCPVRP